LWQFGVKYCLELQAKPVGGVISIGIRLTKVWIEIDIANSGRGVEANDLPHLFGAFKLQQHDNATGLELGCISLGES